MATSADRQPDAPSNNETAREVAGYIVGAVSDDGFHCGWSWERGPMDVHPTREAADGQMVQMWATGFDDHEVFELTRFVTRMRPVPDPSGGS